MRRLWNGLGLIGVLSLALSGCATEDHLRPPKPQETCQKPPDEPQFEKPTEIPKKYLMEETANRSFDMTQPDPTFKKNSGPGGMGAMRAGGGGY